MSTPVHRASPRQSTSAPTQAQGRRDRIRAGGSLGNPADATFLGIQAGAGNRAATVAVQRARGGGKGKEREDAPAPATAAPAASTSFRDRIAAILDRIKKNFEVVDTFVKNVHVPANAGFSQQASATANEGLKHSTAASGAAATSGNLLTEATGTVLSGMDAVKAKEKADKAGSGAAFHESKKKFNSKGTDSVVGAVSTATYALGIAKEATKAQKAANALAVTEASGIASGVTGGVKGARAAIRTGGTARKHHALKKLPMPERTEDAALTRLDQARQQAEWAAAEAYVALDMQWDHDEEGRLDRVAEAIDMAWGAMGDARDAARDLRRAEDVNTINSVHSYALGKQRNKMGKQALTAVGESTKAAGGIVTAVAATAGGAGLASNPVGWGLAAGAAGLILGVTAYRAGRAGMKRYEGARHPERWAEEGTAAEPASRGDALKEALKFWKKVENGERQAMARKIYALAAGPGVPGSGDTTAEMRESARALLIALKAGPADHRLSPEEWAGSLDDPAKTGAWVKEIAEQLSSA
ncbi:hypothetical protein ACGFYA_03160 [Streptomyces sp. NPDC048305]|uniref:hypothetical protein n=1 Tax=Streptomyces sp. NPDC048305 TaxID=3365532 RepID=UPI00371E4212